MPMLYRNIRSFLLLFSLISINLLLFGQDSLQMAENHQNKSGFPQSWVGTWAGTLKIYNQEGIKQSLPMQLQIQPIKGTPNYDWWIIYGEDKEAGKRAYELQPKDPEKGIWVVDEKNTIALECYFHQNKLYSRYLVANNFILVTNEVHGDEMIFEVIAGSGDPVSITGGQMVEEEEIPEVKTFPVGTMQRATLRRD